MNVSSNYVTDIIDEIALEGLDGITLDGLWKRLSVRPNFCFKIDENSKNFIWRICTRLKELKYYELPDKRPPLQFYDFLSIQREQQQDANIELDTLYPYSSIKGENGLFGSCLHYSTRCDITQEVINSSRQAVEDIYSDRLVLVASQECRSLALLGNNCPPNLDFSKSRVQYDILERVGRSRSLGVPTHGKGSLQSIVDDSKSIFHYLKNLIKYRVIKKQSLIGSLQSNPNGSKIYLMRYYGDYMNEHQLILQTAIEELKCRSNYRIPYEEFYQLFDADKRRRIKKYIKTSTFKKYIMVSKVPYREFYPNAPQSEWEKKGQCGERMIRCFQLLDPNTEVTDVFEKECDSDEDETNATSDFLIHETYFRGLTLIQQTYHHVKSSGSHGTTVKDLSEIMGLSRSYIRNLLKRLTQEKHCKCFEEINGRRHTKRYIVGENSKNIAAASEIFEMLSGITPSKGKTNDDNSSLPTENNSEEKTDILTNGEGDSSTEKKIDLPTLEDENVPYRTLRRIGMIIKTIKTHRYRLFFQIYKYVLDEEVKEGLRATVCRMTVNRILQKLEKDGLIKVVDLIRKEDSNGGSSLKLYMEPTFVLDNKLIEMLIHTHTTFKAFEPASDEDDEKNLLDKRFSSVLMNNLMEMKKMLQNIRFKSEKLPTKEVKERELMCSSKFVRLNIIHDLMFYLVYGYTGITDKSQEELLQELSKTCEIDKEIRDEIPTIYMTQASSYLFVPPLQGMIDELPGWLLMSDIIIRLPLSVFVKIIRIVDTTPELLSYLHHPIRKHYLVRDLPFDLRQTLFDRVHGFSTFAYDIKRLGFLGLVQFGQRFGRELYQTPLYVNRNASVMDTTSSPPSYLYVPSGMEFPIKKYRFNTRSDLKEYWQDMCHICLETNLGAKAHMIGKEIPSIREVTKGSLRKWVEPKTPSQAAADDNGTIPGDHLGAGGIDSAMFSFLRHNWIGTTKKNDTLKQSTLKKLPFQKLKKRLARRKHRIHMHKSRLKKFLKRPDVSLPKPISRGEETSTSNKMRKIKEREFKWKRTKKTYYDELDMEALKYKNTLRVAWSPAEDHLLLICKVAMTYLCPVPRGLLRIPWSEVRRNLQKNLTESRDKTQKAIARRLKYMMRNPTTTRSVSLCLEELNQVPELADKYNCNDLIDSLKPSAPNLAELQEKLYEKFHSLVDYLRFRFGKGSSFSVEQAEGDLLPDSLEELKDMYEIDVERIEETLTLKKIRESVIRAILMSSLSCRSDKTSSAIQLFEIYRQYEDDELQTAIRKLNLDKVLAVRKFKNKVFKNGRCLPLSQSPCKLSFSFQISLNTKYSHTLYTDSFSVITKLLQIENPANTYYVDLNDCNVPLYVLATINLVSFRTTVPEQIIVLDSATSMDDDAYARMLRRYCEMLQYSNSDSRFVFASGQFLTAVKPSDEVKGKGGEVQTPEMDEGEPKNKVAKIENVTESKGETEKKTEVQTEKWEMASEKGCKPWRVVLYMMREEAKKEMNNTAGHRSQEFFVVNASQVHCNVSDELEFYAKEMDPKVVNALIKNIVSRYCVPLSLVSEESVYEKFMKTTDGAHAGHLKQVLNFISEKRDFGATNQDLLRNFDRDSLSLIIPHLLDTKIVIKAGINETRYIAQKYCSAWLLNSFRVTRLEREKIKPSEFNAVEIVDNGGGDGTGCDGEDGGPTAAKRRRKGVISSEDLKSDDYNPPSCSTEANNKLKMIIRPWIRVDGSLNRKVIDRFLGSVLGYIMTNPGVTIRAVMNKYAPSLLPIWTKDLIEILYSIGCVSFLTFTATNKTTLFSKMEVVCTDGCSGLDDDSSVVVEAKIDAITTLGLFIGKRLYSKDFLMD